MAFTRKFLSALGIEAEKVDEIISAHVEVVDSLKAERDAFKADAEKLPGVQKELEDLKASTGKEDSYKVKYDALKEEFEEFKESITTEKSKAQKESAYRQLLADAGVAEKRIDAVMRVSDYGSIEFDDEGKIKNSEDLIKGIKEEWADFIPKQTTEGAKVSNPPANDGKTTKSYEEIRAITDPIARQRAMAENPTLFGLPDNKE